MKRRDVLTSLGAGLIATLAGCSTAAKTGYALEENGSSAPTSPLWGQRSATRTGASVVDRSVPVGSSATVHAFGDGVDDPLAVASEAPVLTSEYAVTPTHGGLVAQDRTTGEQEWTFSLPDGQAITTTPVVTGGVVIAATQYEDAYVVDLESGEQVGTIPGTGIARPECSPVLSGSTLLLFGDSLVAYDLEAGERLWSEGPPDAEDGLCADDSFAYVTFRSDGEPGIQAVDLESGDTEWTLNDPVAFETPPAVADGLLYAVTAAQELVCVSAADGTLEWQRSLPHESYDRPAVAGDQVAVNAGMGEQAHVFDVETGDELTTVETGSSTTQPVFTEDALLFVGSDAGLVVLERSSLEVSARHTSVGYVDSQISVGTDEAYYVPEVPNGLHLVTFGGE